jgi:hypothetical protein
MDAGAIYDIVVGEGVERKRKLLRIWEDECPFK